MNILGAFNANMYLAEDRILCFELLARNDYNWVLRYVKGAVAKTDVPMTLVDLMKQRRRWLNGSFFAMVSGVSGRRVRIEWME
jgi:chitin synthase